MSALAMILGGSDDPAAFDVVNEISWHSLFCPFLPAFQAEAYSDGANIGEVPDEMGNESATDSSPSAAATYENSDSDLNGAPSIVYTGGSGTDIRTGSWAAGSLDRTFSVVVIFHPSAVDATHYLVGDYANSNRYLMGYTSTGKLTFKHSGGATYTSTTTEIVAGNSYGLVHKVTTSNNSIYVDGVLVEDSDVAGSDPIGVQLGARSDNNNAFEGSLGLVGLYEGDIRADPAWSDFQSWAEAIYDVSI